MTRQFVLLFAALPLAVAARGQAVVEYSLGTANAAGSAAGMQKAGKAAASILEKAVKALDSAKTASEATVVSSQTRPEAKPVIPPAPEAGAIKNGMTREDLIAKFGEPAMKTAASENSHPIETFWYGAEPKTVTVKLRDGKVESVSVPKPSSSSGVVVLR